MVKAKKYETPASIRGIMSQVKGSINRCTDGAEVTMPVGLAHRILKALGEFHHTEENHLPPFDYVDK